MYGCSQAEKAKRTSEVQWLIDNGLSRGNSSNNLGKNQTTSSAVSLGANDYEKNYNNSNNNFNNNNNPPNRVGIRRWTDSSAPLPLSASAPNFSYDGRLPWSQSPLSSPKYGRQSPAPNPRPLPQDPILFPLETEPKKISPNAKGKEKIDNPIDNNQTNKNNIIPSPRPRNLPPRPIPQTPTPSYIKSPPLSPLSKLRDSGYMDLSTQIVKLNIGGVRYTTTVKTLTGNGSLNNFFSALLSGKFNPVLDDEGYFFIDRDGIYFRPILEYLRTGEWICPPELPERLVLREARFYSVEPHIYSTISDESFCEKIINRHTEFHKKQLQKHRPELDRLKDLVLDSFIQKIYHRDIIESAVFLPSIEHVVRMWKYESEYKNTSKYDASWTAVFRTQAKRTLKKFSKLHGDNVVFDSVLYDVLYSSNSPSEPSSSPSRGVLEAFLWNLRSNFALTVAVHDYHLHATVKYLNMQTPTVNNLNNGEGEEGNENGNVAVNQHGVLEWTLEPHLSIDTEPEVRGFCFVWKGGRRKERGVVGLENVFEGGEAWDLSQHMNKFTTYTSRTKKIEKVSDIEKRMKQQSGGI